MIKFRVSSDRWRQIHPGVYATFTGIPSRGARLWAAVLSAGPGAVLSHETAAELHRLIDKPTEPIHVTVPVAAPGRSGRRGQPLPVGAGGRGFAATQYPPRTKIEETVLDLTQTAATFDDVCGWVTRAFARDLTDEERLRAAMMARTRLRWRADLHELIVAAAGGDHSVLEFRYHRDVERAHGLPEPDRQVPFTTPAGRQRAPGPCVREIRRGGRARRAAGASGREPAEERAGTMPAAECSHCVTAGRG